MEWFINIEPEIQGTIIVCGTILGVVLANISYKIADTKLRMGTHEKIFKDAE